jgi:hypothetical protein
MPTICPICGVEHATQEELEGKVGEIIVKITPDAIDDAVKKIAKKKPKSLIGCNPESCKDPE